MRPEAPAARLNDLLVLGGGAAATALVQAAMARGLSAEALPDPLQTLLGWPATYPALPASDVVPWLVTPGFEMECLTAAGPRRHTARALVLALGVRERLMPFPGCILPGVGGIGMPIEPGDAVLVVGPLPWREAALARCAAAGAVVSKAPAIHHVVRVEREAAILRVRLASENGDDLVMPAARLMVADGWLPATDAFRLLQAAMQFDLRAEAWLPLHDAAGRCSVPLLYVLDGSPVPLAEAIAADLRRCVWQTEAMPEPQPGDGTFLSHRITTLADDTVICPCEGVTAGSARALAAGGVRVVNQLKSASRCGMGECGGRLCEDVVARVLAAATGQDRAAVGYWTGRAPLVPVPLRALTGDYDYSDIQLPSAAPL